MVQGTPYSSVEAEQAKKMFEAAERAQQLDIPRPLRAALAHSLTAVAKELDNGRSVGIEVRRAARHVMEAVDEVLSRPAGGS